MTDISRKGTCETCRHWQPFPSNGMAGHCPILGALVFTTSSNHKPDGMDIAITSDVNGRPTSDVSAVRTTQHFGCIHHEPTP